MIKNKIIIFVIIVMIIVSSISVYATYKYFAKDVSYTPSNSDFKVTNVEDALNSLYERNNTGYVKKIFNHVSPSVNYTYNVEEDGKYIAGLQLGNMNPVDGISTSGDVILERTEKYNSKRISGIKIIEAKKGDTIIIKGTNCSSYNLTAFIYQLYNISTKEVIQSTYKYDGAASGTYTGTSDGDRVLIVSIANSTNIRMTTSYTGLFNTSFVHSDNAYVDYVVLKKDASITASAYGYNWGGASVYVIK